MTNAQVLRRVELPLSSPFVMTGIRTSAVAVVATATLLAYVGGGGLGRFIIDGSRISYSDPRVFVGALFVALLSVIVELFLALVQHLIVPRAYARGPGARPKYASRTWFSPMTPRASPPDRRDPPRSTCTPNNGRKSDEKCEIAPDRASGRGAPTRARCSSHPHAVATTTIRRRRRAGRPGRPCDQTLVFGGPPECLERPLCLGDTEKSLYDLDFKEVKKLDPGGPITVKALQDGTIQVGLLFTGSSVIDKDFVLLEDDKGLQPADNPTAIINKSKATPDVVAIIDAVNKKITLDEYNKMALSVFNDKEDPSTVAGDFLKRVGLDKTSDKGAGYVVDGGFEGLRRCAAAQSGVRPGPEGQRLRHQLQGQHRPDGDGVPAREGRHDRPLRRVHRHVLTFLGGTASADSQKTYDDLTAKIESEGGVVVATTPATAQDVNGFYVTKETADKYNLKTISDLKQPAP